MGRRAARSAAKVNVHQQARLSAGTVADDDELASQFSHGRRIWGLELVASEDVRGLLMDDGRIREKFVVGTGWL